MTDRSDHLIERAAALLRSASGSQVADGPPAGASASDGPAEGNAVRPMPPSGRANSPPVFIQPPRPTPPAQLRQPDQAERTNNRSMLARGSSVAEIRGLSDHAPITLAMLEHAGLMVARANRTRTTEEYRIVIGRVLRALHDEVDPQFPSRTRCLPERGYGHERSTRRGKELHGSQSRRQHRPECRRECSDRRC